MFSFKEYILNQISTYFNRTKTFSNPIRHSSPSYYLVEAIQNLGFNKWISREELMNEFMRITNSIIRSDSLTIFDYYCKRIATNKFYQTIDTLSLRVLKQMSWKNGDVYKRLAKMHAYIEISKDATHIRLNFNAPKKDDGSSPQSCDKFSKPRMMTISSMVNAFRKLSQYVK